MRIPRVKDLPIAVKSLIAPLAGALIIIAMTIFVVLTTTAVIRSADEADGAERLARPGNRSATGAHSGTHRADARSDLAGERCAARTDRRRAPGSHGGDRSRQRPGAEAAGSRRRRVKADNLKKLARRLPRQGKGDRRRRAGRQLRRDDPDAGHGRCIDRLDAAFQDFAAEISARSVGAQRRGRQRDVAERQADRDDRRDRRRACPRSRRCCRRA